MRSSDAEAQAPPWPQLRADPLALRSPRYSTESMISDGPEFIEALQFHPNPSQSQHFPLEFPAL